MRAINLPILDALSLSHIYYLKHFVNVLFLAPLPEPITGQSLASRVLLDELKCIARVDVVDLTKRTFRQGIDSLGRIREVLSAIRRAWALRKTPDVVYLTIAESRAGNAKDLLFYAMFLGRLRRVVIHLHGGEGLRRLLALDNPLTRAVNRVFLSRLGGVIVLGERHVDIFEGLVARERIHVVPNFAEDVIFWPHAKIATKFSVVSPLRVLFLSNLLPGKGYQELVAAFESLSTSERERFIIDFAGGFEDEASRDAFLASIALYPQLRYQGIVHGEAKQALFGSAHVFCLPTYYPYEGQPISILEAYASGCAVITTDHSGIFDIFSDGVNGIAVVKRSIPSLVAALRRAATNPGELHRHALLNRDYADRNFRASTYSGRVIEVLRGVAAIVGTGN